MKKIFLLSCFIIAAGMSKAQVITIHHPEAIPIKLERVTVPLRDLPAKSIAKTEKRGERDNPSLEHQIPITNPNPSCW